MKFILINFKRLYVIKLRQAWNFSKHSRVAGIEPTHANLKAAVLPLNYTPYIFPTTITGLLPSMVIYSKMLLQLKSRGLCRLSLTATDLIIS